MSEDVRETGKIQRIQSLFGECPEDVAKRICEEYGIERPDITWDYTETLMDSDDFMVINSELYRVLEYKKLSNDECVLNILDDGVIEFDVSYYNAGAGLSEVIEWELNK